MIDDLTRTLIDINLKSAERDLDFANRMNFSFFKAGNISWEDYMKNIHGNLEKYKQRIAKIYDNKTP